MNKLFLSSLGRRQGSSLVVSPCLHASPFQKLCCQLWFPNMWASAGRPRRCLMPASLPEEVCVSWCGLRPGLWRFGSPALAGCRQACEPRPEGGWRFPRASPPWPGEGRHGALRTASSPLSRAGAGLAGCPCVTQAACGNTHASVFSSENGNSWTCLVGFL